MHFRGHGSDRLPSAGNRLDGMGTPEQEDGAKRRPNRAGALHRTPPARLKSIFPAHKDRHLSCTPAVTGAVANEPRLWLPADSASPNGSRRRAFRTSPHVSAESLAM